MSAQHIQFLWQYLSNWHACLNTRQDNNIKRNISYFNFNMVWWKWQYTFNRISLGYSLTERTSTKRGDRFRQCSGIVLRTFDRDRIDVQIKMTSLFASRNVPVSLAKHKQNYKDCMFSNNSCRHLCVWMCANLKNEMPKSWQREEWSEREVARKVCPCLIMIFARNCAKGPKPTIPIFRFLEGEEEEEEDDETAMLLMERDKGGGGEAGCV